MSGDVPAEITTRIRVLADTIRRETGKNQVNKPGHEVLWGVVTLVDTTNHLVNVLLNGDATNAINLNYLGSYGPTINDFVMVTRYGHDLIVVGALAPEGASAGGASFLRDREYIVQGALMVASGQFGYLGPFHFSLDTGQSALLLGVFTQVRAGSAVINFTQNGSSIAGLGAVAVSTASSYTAATTPPIVSNGDHFAPVISSVSGADGLSADFVFRVIA